MNRLLIISCSQRKVKSPGLLPAIDRYDGPTYRILRKLRRENQLSGKVDICIISARYVILHYNEPIIDYDLPMTIRRANQIAPVVQAELKGLLSLKPRYEQIFINLGKTYMRTLEGFHWGLVSTIEASGGIGLKNSQMKAWLEKTVA